MFFRLHLSGYNAIKDEVSCRNWYPSLIQILGAMALINLAWLVHVKWRSGVLSFWYAFPPSLVVVRQVITWLRHVTCRDGSVSFWYVLPPRLVIAAFVHYDIFNLSPDHVIKIHTIGMLATISSFPQKLVYIQFPFWNFGR